MPPGPPFPSPLPPWARGILYVAPYAYAAGSAAFDYFYEAAALDDLNWRRVLCVGERQTPAGTSEDVAQISFDVINFTGGVGDATWTPADYTAVQARLATLLAALAVRQSDHFTWTENRYYVAQFAGPGLGLADSGPPEYVAPTGIAGAVSGSVGMPYQVSLTVTEKTAIRKSWGRFYMPNPGISIVDDYGRFKSSAINAIADDVTTCYDGLLTDGFIPVVASGRQQALLSVTAIQVDDVADVQRTRRSKQTLERAVRTVA